jgi:acetyl esterase/lipase
MIQVFSMSRSAGVIFLFWSLSLTCALPADAADGDQPPTDPLPKVTKYAGKIRIQKDVPYSQAGRAYQKFDMYLPQEGGPFPVVICIHGGGFNKGSKDQMGRVAAYLASRGFAAAAPAYFLPQQEGKAAFPQNVEDVKCVVRFLRSHAKKYELDPDRIAALGTSAGAYLSLMLGATAEQAELEGEEGWPQASDRIQAVVDVAGVCDRRGGLGSGTLVLLGPGYEHKQALRELASPVVHVTGKMPPVYILHGDADPTVDVSSAHQLRAALSRADVAHKLHIVPGAGHHPLTAGPAAKIADWLHEQLDADNREAPRE